MLLRGIKPIGQFIGESERHAYYLAEKKHMPGGKIGMFWIASRRALRSHIEKLTGATDA